MLLSIKRVCQGEDADCPATMVGREEWVWALQQELAANPDLKLDEEYIDLDVGVGDALKTYLSTAFVNIVKNLPYSRAVKFINLSLVPALMDLFTKVCVCTVLPYCRVRRVLCVCHRSYISCVWLVVHTCVGCGTYTL